MVQTRPGKQLANADALSHQEYGNFTDRDQVMIDKVYKYPPAIVLLERLNPGSWQKALPEVLSSPT